jgi:PAS domain S-box-containing protein
MDQTLHRAPEARSLRIPLWDDYGQAERFAGVLVLAALFAAVPYLVAGRMVVAQLCFAIATALLALCTGSARGGPRWLLGLGTPITMTVGGFALLWVTGGSCVASAAMLGLVPAVAVLWGGSERVGWVFLVATLAASFAVLLFAPEGVHLGAVPWIADARAPWLSGPLALGLFLLARSWADAHGAWQQELIAIHAVLAASEARFKAYVENAHDVTAEIDAQGRVLFVTGDKKGFYALPVAELLGTASGDYIHPGDRTAALQAFQSAARGRAAVSEPVRYRGTRDGWRYLRFAVNSYRTREGKLRYVLQARDETDAALAEAERERRVAELEAALARSRALLSQCTCAREGATASS